MPRRPKKHRMRPATLANARRLRADMTPAEKELWRRLRAGGLQGCKFRRQYVINRFVVDFYSAAAGLIVEIDGDTHDGRETCDEARTRRLSQLGYHVIRFTNTEVHEQLDEVLEVIFRACRCHPRPSPWPSP